MELGSDMARFTAVTWTRIVAANGTKCAEFEPGQTMAIHRDLWGPAMTAGLVPESPEVLAKESAKETKPAPKKSKEEMIHEGLLEAVRELIAKGDPKDFTVVGLPRTASVKNLVDFDFTARQVQQAFEIAVHEVTQNGDDSKEHPEQNSDSAE